MFKRPVHSSSAFFAWVTVAALGLLLGACQRTPDPPTRGPADAFNRSEALAVQDSLMQIVQPGWFGARLAGDPFNPSTETALVRRQLAGTVAVTRTGATGGGTSRVHFYLDGGRQQVTLSVTLPPGDPASLQTGTYEQRRERLPAAEAVLRAGRHRFASRSGTLDLERSGTGTMQGRFFFEMQTEVSQDDWFVLVGVFKAGGTEGAAATARPRRCPECGMRPLRRAAACVAAAERHCRP